MSIKIHVSTIGIVIVAAGSVLVWKYIGEIAFSDHAKIDGENFVFTVPDATPELRQKMRRAKLLSNLGIVLITFGSAVQVFSNYMVD